MNFQSVKFQNNELFVPNLDNIPMSTDNYLTTEKFFIFFDTLLNALADNDISSVCLNHAVNYTIADTFLNIDFVNMSISMSKPTIQYIKTLCEHTALILIPIKLIFINAKQSYDNASDTSDRIIGAHSNLLIIDNTRHTIEYFEPHGFSLLSVIGQQVYIPRLVSNIIKTIFPTFTQYNVINAATNCLVGVQGLQNITDPSSGHCLAWTLLFITMRTINSSYTSTFIYDFLITHYTIFQLDEMIKRFITFINTLPIPQTKDSNPTFDSNLIDFLDEYDTTAINKRIHYLAYMYFSNINSNILEDINRIFAELITYQSFPGFHQILQSVVWSLDSDSETSDSETSETSDSEISDMMILQ